MNFFFYFSDLRLDITGFFFIGKSHHFRPVQEEINGIINVCTGQPRTLADRVEQFLRDKNYKIKLDYGVFPDRPYDSPGVWGDPTKINAILKDAGLA